MNALSRSVWSSILLNNLLTQLNATMWKAIHAGRLVVITVDGRPVGEFIPHDDGHVLIEIDGRRVADVDASPVRYR